VFEYSTYVNYANTSWLLSFFYRRQKVKPLKDIRVASVQFEHQDGDKPANLAVIKSFVAQAAANDVKIIAFPECCITGYWFLHELSRDQVDELAEPVFDGPSSQVLGELAKQHQITIGAGLVERASDGQLYNTYVVAMPDGKFQKHRKLHCFVSEHMASGDTYTVFDTPYGCRVGILICYDNNLIENVRATALQGAEILLAPHQTGGCDSGAPQAMGLVDPALWENRGDNPDAIEAEFKGDKGRDWLLRWLPSRAHDNGIFLIFSNGVGTDGNEIRTGNAMIIDCYGRILAETWEAADRMVTADLIASMRDRCTGTRWMRARRPELYDVLAVPTGREVSAREARFT